MFSMYIHRILHFFPSASCIPHRAAFRGISKCACTCRCSRCQNGNVYYRGKHFVIADNKIKLNPPDDSPRPINQRKDYARYRARRARDAARNFTRIIITFFRLSSDNDQPAEHCSDDDRRTETGSLALLWIAFAFAAIVFIHSDRGERGARILH